MRALRWPDAFPKEDIAIRNNLGGVSAKVAEQMSQVWRPWRSYAVLHIWKSLTPDKVKVDQLETLQPAERTGRFRKVAVNVPVGSAGGLLASSLRLAHFRPTLRLVQNAPGIFVHAQALLHRSVPFGFILTLCALLKALQN